MHERVHNPFRTVYSKTKKSINSVTVYNDDINIFGVIDCLEFYKPTEGKKEEYIIVEHKPHKPKNKEFNEDDALQVYAQKLCVDSVFNTNSKGVIYYAQEKTRVSLPFEIEEKYYKDLLDTCLENMRILSQKNEIPSIKKGQKCSGCSFIDICMPKRKRTKNVRDTIFETLKE